MIFFLHGIYFKSIRIYSLILVIYSQKNRLSSEKLLREKIIYFSWSKKFVIGHTQVLDERWRWKVARPSEWDDIPKHQLSPQMVCLATCLLPWSSWYWVFFRAELLQSCLTLCDPKDWSPLGSSTHGILQARILEWVVMPSSRYCVHWPVNSEEVLYSLLCNAFCHSRLRPAQFFDDHECSISGCVPRS